VLAALDHRFFKEESDLAPFRFEANGRSVA